MEGIIERLRKRGIGIKRKKEKRKLGEKEKVFKNEKGNIIVNHQKNRFKGIGDVNTIKKILWKKYPYKDKISIHSLRLDHFIPYSISLDNSFKNLQLLTPKEHAIKTGISKKILNILKKRGYIERITKYSYELKLPIKDMIKLYVKVYKEITGKVPVKIYC